VTPLANAVISRKRELVTKLLDDGHDPNVASLVDGTTPLHHACVAGDIEMVKMLLEKNANVEIQTHDGNYPLHKAARRGAVDIAQLLMKFGANPLVKNSKGMTPAMQVQSAPFLFAKRGIDPPWHMYLAEKGDPKDKFALMHEYLLGAVEDAKKTNTRRAGIEAAKAAKGAAKDAGYIGPIMQRLLARLKAIDAEWEEEQGKEREWEEENDERERNNDEDVSENQGDNSDDGGHWEDEDGEVGWEGEEGNVVGADANVHGDGGEGEWEGQEGEWEGKEGEQTWEGEGEWEECQHVEEEGEQEWEEGGGGEAERGEEDEEDEEDEGMSASAPEAEPATAAVNESGEVPVI
jgi:hypothetical protein